MPPKKPQGVDLVAMLKKKKKGGAKKKPPPPPACFTPEDIARFKEAFKLFDEDDIGNVPVKVLGTLLRKLGFNPKNSEIDELCTMFLENEFCDTIEFFEFLFMVEAKTNWGDDPEADVMAAFKALGHDEKETKICVLNTIQEELMYWGEVLTDQEYMDMPRMILREKCFVDLQDGTFMYEKFIEAMNNKDTRAIPEPINYFKLDQKTLAKMAMEKAMAEKEEMERIAAEKRAREEAKRQKMIQDGLLPPD